MRASDAERRRLRALLEDAPEDATPRPGTARGDGAAPMFTIRTVPSGCNPTPLAPRDAAARADEEAELRLFGAQARDALSLIHI